MIHGFNIVFTISLAIILVAFSSILSLADAHVKSNSISRQNSSQFMWPTVSRKITSPFGNRHNPQTGAYEFHTGVDIAHLTQSDNVFAASNGVVVYSGTYGTYGNIVVINSNWNGGIIQTRYAHLRSTYVRAGQTVSRGTVVGIMGTTGASTGIHLHYEVRNADSMSTTWSATARDPVMFHRMDDAGFTPQSIKNPLEMSRSISNKSTIVSFSEYDGHGLSINNTFVSAEYIVNSSLDTLKGLGIKDSDIELLIEMTAHDLDANIVSQLRKIQEQLR